MIIRLLFFFLCVVVSTAAIAEDNCMDQGCPVVSPGIEHHNTPSFAVKTAELSCIKGGECYDTQKNDEREKIPEMPKTQKEPVFVQPKVPPFAVKAPKPPENRIEQKKVVERVITSPTPNRVAINKKVIHIEKEEVVVKGEDTQKTSDKAKLFDATVSILPENTTMLHLSNLDVNRIVCPVEMGEDSIIYSKEKRITVEIRGRNAFVKFLILKSEEKETKVTNPVEFHVLCGPDVFSIIAYPQAIPAQTVKLLLKKDKHEVSALSVLPYEERLLKIIQDVLFNKTQGYTVTSLNQTIEGFKGMDLVLRNIIKIDTENLIVKEYLIKLKNNSTAEKISIKEKDFIRSEIINKPVAMMLDKLELRKNEFSRLIVIGREEIHE